MHPLSQYQAYRLLELIAVNRTRVKPYDHVDSDIWARADPPVRGHVYASRTYAEQHLKAGSMGAGVVRVELAGAEKRAVLELEAPGSTHGEKEVARIDGHLGAGVGASGGGGGGGGGMTRMMMRVESEGSRMSKISSVPSFGRIREPLSGDSVRLAQVGGEDAGDGTRGVKGDAAMKRMSGRAEYEEFGSEALITRVYDEADDDLEGEVSGRLFGEIGPSVSVAHGIGEDGEGGAYAKEYVAAEGTGEGWSNVAVVPPSPPHSPALAPPPLLPSILPMASADGHDREGEEEMVVAVGPLPSPSPPPLPEQPVVYREGEGIEQEGIAPPPPTPPPAEAFVKREEEDLCFHEREESEEGKRSGFSSDYLSRSEYTEYSEDTNEKTGEKEGDDMSRVETLGSMESVPEEVVALRE